MGQVLHGSARTTAAVRGVLGDQVSTRALVCVVADPKALLTCLA